MRNNSFILLEKAEEISHKSCFPFLRTRGIKPCISFLGGFTLLEVSMATLVFIVGVVSILLVYVNSTQLSEISFNTNEAVFAAQKMMEETRSYDITQLSTGNYCPSTVNSCSGTIGNCPDSRVWEFSPEEIGRAHV